MLIHINFHFHLIWIYLFWKKESSHTFRIAEKKVKEEEVEMNGYTYSTRMKHEGRKKREKNFCRINKCLSTHQQKNIEIKWEQFAVQGAIIFHGVLNCITIRK